MVAQMDIEMVVGWDNGQLVDEKVLTWAFWRVEWMAAEKGYVTVVQKVF